MNKVTFFIFSFLIKSIGLGLFSIDCYITKSQLAWAGHVARMEFERLPRKLLSCWVTSKRPLGSPEFTYGRGLKKALIKANLPLNNWYELAQNRTEWKSLLSNARF